MPDPVQPAALKRLLAQGARAQGRRTLAEWYAQRQRRNQRTTQRRRAK